MTKEVVIVGAGRQGRNVLEILRFDSNQYPVAGFIDDTKTVGEMILGCPVLGGFDQMADPAFVACHDWFVALGDSPVRQQIGRRLKRTGATVVNVTHPTAQISRYCQMGSGVYVAAFASIYSCSRVEDWALLEACSVVGSDTFVGDAAFLGPACVLTGGSAVGALSFLGAGTVVLNNIRIGSACVIGANALVVKDIPDGVRAQGVPARIIKTPL